MTVSFERLTMWTAGLRIGAACLPREPVLGIKRLLLPASYWRLAEFAYVWKRLAGFRGAHLLDLGSPKDLAAMFARSMGCAVTAVDILPNAITLSKRHARAQGLDGRGNGKVASEVQDGRTLTYPDNTFDAAYSVSVLEHIPDHGDTAAMQELVRVVKPGGLVVVTTPCDRAYRETFVQESVYERQQVAAEPVFFERHYDEAALGERLFAPSKAQVVDRETWGEGRVRVESLLNRSGPLRTFLSPLEAGLSGVFLRRLRSNRTGHPMAAFFTLRKPG